MRRDETVMKNNQHSTVGAEAPCRSDDRRDRRVRNGRVDIRQQSTPTGARRTERGQSTVEYALLLLGVATLALLVVAWASGTDGIGRLFDAVLDDIVARF